VGRSNVNLGRRVLAVVDDAAAAPRAVAELRAAGLIDIATLTGPEGADAIDASGDRGGRIRRVGRAVRFGVEDQMPALAWYEAALREGRTVLAVRTLTRDQTLTAVRILAAHGGHFVNHFGRLATEEFGRWRGPEPAIHDLLK
jgi:hypothetical protein